MEAVESYIDGLQNGSEDLGLVRLKDAKYQAKVEEQKEYFQKLKEEVQHVRESGYYNTNIIEDSETFSRSVMMPPDLRKRILRGKHHSLIFWKW